MASNLNETKILNALRMIEVEGRDIVTMGLIGGLTLSDGPRGTKVGVVLQIPPKGGPAGFDEIKGKIERSIGQLEGAGEVAVILTAHQSTPQPRPAHVPQKILLPDVRYVVAVASGKGGVGKSTTAVNLAASLMRKGLRVGLLDGDIYGPSIPRLLSVSGKPAVNPSTNQMIPHSRFGLKIMSMGFLIAEEAPMIWRGPMVHSAITQLFRDVEWGTLDILVVDLPPGTGDAQLTLSQSAPLSGAVIVSTPQDIALLDARKGLAMFQKVEIPVLGFIENMSYFLCPHCGERSDIFSHGGARHEADKLGVPFLGEIPLNIAVREHSDLGNPIVLAEPEGEISARYATIADTLWSALTKSD